MLTQPVLASLQTDGFAIVNDVFSESETEQIAALIQAEAQDSPLFRKSTDLFAIRQFFREIPKAVPLIFTPAFRELLTQTLGTAGFAVKAIYFDKPAASNWFVAWHQDLTISVTERKEVPGYGPYTVKQNQYAVQAPASLLEQMLTLRIHLDDTDEANGALKVLPGSHAVGIERPEKLVSQFTQESVCAVRKGGVMLMKPLLMHRSSRTTNGARRRVIHIEFSTAQLPQGLQWAERH
ncbi:phytanoyl-CoA dioxygenase family protein [Deminuibacter soli]|uniref:Phytanoyl-CoA dioxygenase n=1 Tax=Deminuibacter soli TaxID=2291815 RepID=A0A3E1NK81_9BACT|nr:phytanoyl-CoA dioxygenase family protein [Deminuibacter soli]RFM28281.1 phytanoyl-CoA dioxygenase [Deminuibacter soli]